jgi:hypothetical protein
MATYGVNDLEKESGTQMRRTEVDGSHLVRREEEASNEETFAESPAVATNENTPHNPQHSHVGKQTSKRDFERPSWL